MKKRKAETEGTSPQDGVCVEASSGENRPSDGLDMTHGLLAQP